MAKAEQKEANLNRIKEASKSLLSYDASNSILTTAPEIKPYIKVNDNEFAIGSYVNVLADYSTGFNRPPGCGCVLRIANDVIDVKYSPAHDGGRLHRNLHAKMVKHSPLL